MSASPTGRQLHGRAHSPLCAAGFGIKEAIEGARRQRGRREAGGSWRAGTGCGGTMQRSPVLQPAGSMPSEPMMALGTALLRQRALGWLWLCWEVPWVTHKSVSVGDIRLDCCHRVWLPLARR